MCSDGKHQFEQWLRANCIMDIVDDEHKFGQWLSTCNLWSMCILVERRIWHEPINVMGNYPERGRHSGREIIKWRLELHVLS